MLTGSGMAPRKAMPVEPIVLGSVGPSRLSTAGERVMRDPAEFRKYAEECKRLASTMPEHREGLLSMAEAWIACAQAAEKNGAAGKSAA